MTKKVLRFAPSPTGYLHVGNIRTALFNYLQAKKLGADFILRLDDTDSVRSSQHFIDQIKRDLDWLGINWDDDVIYQSNSCLLYTSPSPRDS